MEELETVRQALTEVLDHARFEDNGSEFGLEVALWVVEDLISFHETKERKTNL